MILPFFFLSCFIICTLSAPPYLYYGRPDGLPWELIFKICEYLPAQDLNSWIRSSLRLSGNGSEDLMLYHMIHRADSPFDPWENEMDHEMGQSYPTAYKRFLCHPLASPPNITEKFKFALIHGRLELVKHAIHSTVDPSEDDNWAIRFASELGHLPIVELLLLDPRVNCTARNNYALTHASRNGHFEVVARLIQHGAASKSGQTNLALEMASLNGHLEIFNLLLENTSEKELEESLILVASRNGHLPIVNRLLELKPGLDPSYQNNYPLILACENGHHLVVDRLLQDPRVNPSARNNKAISEACDNGHHLVVDRLLLDERVDPFVNDHEAIISAWNRGDHLVYDSLKKYYQKKGEPLLI